MTKPVRRIRVVGDIAYVPLTKGYEAIIDSADACLVGGFNWHADVRPQGIYVVRNSKTKECAKRRIISLHRFLMGSPEGVEVDHRDCNGLNNRRSNLRRATRAQNSQNRRAHSNNQCGAKGVIWSKQFLKWQASIHIRGKDVYLGRFETKELASAAYAKASPVIHGEFGRAK